MLKQPEKERKARSKRQVESKKEEGGKTKVEVKIETVMAPALPPPHPPALPSPTFNPFLECWRMMERNWPETSECLALLMILLYLWAIAFLKFPADKVGVNSPLIRLCCLFIGSKILGVLVSLVGVPDLIGMMAFGVIYNVVGLSDFRGHEDSQAFLRQLAMVNIMALAGLQLNLRELKKLAFIAFRLAIIPSIAEVAVITILAYCMLKMPWLWGILLGTAITAVSPNVVISMLMILKARKLGLYKGIHTLIMASNSLNDIFTIFWFGVIVGMIFSNGTVLSEVLQVPAGAGIGLMYGGLVGFVSCLVPSSRAPFSDILQFAMTVFGGLSGVIGSQYFGYPSGGALAVMTLGIIGRMFWRTQKQKDKVELYFLVLAKFMKPIAFGLLGNLLDFSSMDPMTVLYGFLIILVATSCRLGVAYLLTTGGDYTWQERAFITISTIPKATVQAAIGPIALDMAEKRNSKEDIALANKVLICSVLSIVMTAPFFTILMLKLGKKWLKKNNEDGKGVIVTITTPA